jgi:hypothetical protein
MRPSLLLLAVTLLLPAALEAQGVPAGVARERAERTHWLERDPLSPARAIALAPVPADGLTLGEGGEVAIPGAPAATVREVGGSLLLRGWGAERTLVRGRATAVNGTHLVPLGAPGRTTLAVYHDAAPGKRPRWFPYRADRRYAVTLAPVAPRAQRILSPEGLSVEATEVGTVDAGGVSLRVMRVPGASGGERLLINFRDATNGDGSYPAGRFVELTPQGGERYLLDLNRAFNPNCAYSGAFPCPIPWSGNAFTERVEAGEMYPLAEGPRTR